MQSSGRDRVVVVARHHPRERDVSVDTIFSFTNKGGRLIRSESVSSTPRDALTRSIYSDVRLTNLDFTVSSIPQPHTWVLILVGGAFLGMFCKRRMKDVGVR